MPGLRAVVDHHRCVGVAMCVATAPGAFAVNDEGLSEYQPGSWERDDLVEAADACPMSAITVFADDVEVT
jgi:ferredoxin